MVSHQVSAEFTLRVIGKIEVEAADQSEAVAAVRAGRPDVAATTRTALGKLLTTEKVGAVLRGEHEIAPDARADACPLTRRKVHDMLGYAVSNFMTCSDARRARLWTGSIRSPRSCRSTRTSCSAATRSASATSQVGARRR